MTSHCMSFLCIFAYFLLSFIGPCYSCGGLVHGELAQRSRFLFSKQHDPKNMTFPDGYATQTARWLERHDGSILAGSFMPDWGYGCSGGDDLSEIMHWPPFLKAAVEYVRDTYPQPENNEKAQALIAFLFAVSGHQVQDAAWHSIGLLMGFIDEVSKVDLKDSFSDAHETLDWGGDAIFGKRYSGQKGAADWAYGDWYVPVDDLAAIYERLGKSLSTWQMKYCIVRLRSVLLASAKGASIFFTRYSQRSPFMLDYFDKYYLGGIDDMTSSTVECWSSLIEWFRNGNIGDPWELCPLTAAITRRTEISVPCITDKWREELKAEEEEMMKHLHAEDKEGVFRVWYDGPRPSDTSVHTTRQSSSRNFTGCASYSRFGQSMALGEFGIGDPLQIAVSSPFQTKDGHAPYIGNVHLVSISNADISLTPTLPHPTRSYEMPALQFGFSLAALKINTRNISALAVGTPGYFPSGVVWIYSTSALNNLLGPALEIKPWHPTRHKSQYGKRGFGSKLFVADVDGDGKDDLLIASPWNDFTGGPILPDPPSHTEQTWDPQHGSISVFTGQQLELMMDGIDVLDEDCAYSIMPPTANGFERFGTSIAFAKKSGVLIVGEPGSGRNSSVLGRGMVYGIKVTKELRSVVFSIEGDFVDENSLSTEFGGGGLTSGVTDDGTEWIAIAAHNTDYAEFRQAGLIHIYTLMERFNKTSNASIYIAERIVTLRAEEPQSFDKFGAVAESDGKDTLWVSSGWAAEEQGVVWTYNVSNSLRRRRDQKIFDLLDDDSQHVFDAPHDDYEVAKVFARGNEPKARFGDSLLVGDMNGDGVVDIAVGSPFSRGRDQSYPLAGKIDIFFLNKTV